MALEDMMGLLTIAPAFLRELPLITFIMYIAFVVSFSFFLGFIAMKGIRERWYMSMWVKLGLRFGVGLLSFLIGLSISGFVPQISSNPLIVMFQSYAGIFLGGFIASILVMIGLWLASYHIFNIEAMKDYIKHLEVKLKRSEETQREEAKKTKVEKILNPVRIGGIAIVAALVAFTILYFPGLPDPYNDVLSAIGIEQKDVDLLIETVGGNQDMPQGCENFLVLMQAHQDDIMNNRLPKSNDQDAKRLVEAEGYTVFTMYDVVHKGDDYIIAVADDYVMCHLRGGELCGCMDMSPFITTT